MSIEALWQLKFATVEDDEVFAGGGVIIFKTGRVFGGDSSFYYLGEYTLEDGEFTCHVQVRRHWEGLRAATAFENAHLTLRGKYAGNAFTVRGTMQEDATVVVVAKLQRLADLP